MTSGPDIPKITSACGRKSRSAASCGSGVVARYGAGPGNTRPDAGAGNEAERRPSRRAIGSERWFRTPIQPDQELVVIRRFGQQDEPRAQQAVGGISGKVLLGCDQAIPEPATQFEIEVATSCAMTHLKTCGRVRVDLDPERHGLGDRIRLEHLLLCANCDHRSRRAAFMDLWTDGPAQ